MRKLQAQLKRSAKILLPVLLGLLFITAPVFSLDSTSSNQSLSTNIVSSLAFRLLDSTKSTEIDTLNLNMTPEQHGSFTKDSLIAEVDTNSPKGYSLYMESSYQIEDNNYTTSLVHNDNSSYTIPTLTKSVSETDFSKKGGDYINYWGYSKSWEEETASSDNDASLFLPVPAHGESSLIRETGEAEASSDTTITIGVTADMSKASGTYENEVLFTVVVNAVPVKYTLMFENGTSEAVSGMPETIIETVAQSQYTITLPNTRPTRSGYTFVGWKDENGDIYQPGSGYTIIAQEFETGTATLTAMWETPTFWNISYMQEMTSAICNSVKTPSNATGDAVTLVDNEYDYNTTYHVTADGMPYVAQRKLYDIRDNNIYTVRKLADGNCWMTENLRLEFDGKTELTSETTNITDSDVKITPSTTQARTAAETSEEISAWSTASDTPTKVEAERWLSRSTRGKRESSSSTGDLTGENQLYGTYYNWYTATLGTGLYDMRGGAVAEYSVCPTGWQLPRYEGTGSWVYLIKDSYGLIEEVGDQGSTDVNDVLHKAPFSFPYVGNIIARTGKVGNQGIFGRWWGSSAHTYTTTYYMANDGTYVRPTTSYYKSYGFSVRCVTI